MENLGPTQEQLNHGVYEAPERSQKKDRTAFRKKSELEQMKIEPEHLRAGLKLYVNYHGSMGADVRRDEVFAAYGVPDDFRQHSCAQALSCMKNAVCSDLIWRALLEVCAHDRSPIYVGAVYGGYKNRQQAKAYGDAIVTSGLDILATYLGFRPPDTPR